MKKILSIAMSVMLPFSAAALPVYANDTEVKVYVSVNGDDSKDAKQLTSAVKSIERAIELANTYKTDGKTTHIIFTEGTYNIDRTVKLSAAESGTQNAPVIFRAYKGATVNFTSGQKIDRESFSVSDNSDLQSSVLGKVYEADLTGINIEQQKNSRLNAQNDGLYADGYLKQLAKWPNEGWEKSDGAYDEAAMLSTYPIQNDRAADWDVNNVYLGAWLNGYSYKPDLIAAEFTPDSMKLGVNIANLRFALFNSLSELDAPGEYYVDYDAKKLYYYPEQNAENDIYFMSNTKNLFSLEGASNIKFENINFHAVNGKVFTMKNCDSITIYCSDMSGLGDLAVDAAETTNLLIAASNISEMKRGALKVSGGDQKTLTSSNDVIRNCRIHDLSKVYKTGNPAITLGERLSNPDSSNGVGITVKNCEIYNSPQSGILFSGNNHIIENNRIYNMLLDVWDSGFIYAMRSWTGRGTVIRNNYLYIQKNVFDYTHIKDSLIYGAGTDNEGIYLDDLQSGITATGNIIYNISRGFDWGGGNDNVCTDNIVISCRRGLRYDCRGLWEWGRKWIDAEAQYGGLVYREINNLINGGYDKSLWNRYDGFAQTVERIEAFNESIAADNSAENRLKELLILGRPYNRTLQNNVFTGEWAELYRDTPNKHNSFLFLNPGYLSDGTKDNYAETSDWYSLMSNEEAGISINGDEIEITGENLPAGISKSTSAMGVKEDEYIPSYCKNEFDVNTANTFSVIAAVYDGSGKLREVQTVKNCYFYDGQPADISIDVPDGADEAWYATLMLWDSAEGMRPVLDEKIMLFK